MPATKHKSHSQAPPQDKTIFRGARKPNSSKNVYIKNVKEVDLSTLKCMKPNVKDVYFVRLKSDDEGGSKEKRQEHIDEIFGLCCTNKRDTAGNEFEGIEVRFEEAMPAYAGHFNPVVLRKIEANKNIVVSVNGRYEMAMSEEHSIPSRNWGSAKISLEKSEWDQMPIESSDGFKCGQDKKVYKYDCGNHLGKGVTIYVIDARGFLRSDFENKPTRVQSDLWNESGTTEGHGTVVTSIAAGETCGIAPEADVWVWSPDILDNILLIAALEKIVKKENENKKELESDNGKTYYSVLNCSWFLKELYSEDGREDYEAAKGALSEYLRTIIGLGVFTVVAAGNDSVEVKCSESNEFPRNIEDVILVGSSDKDNRISKFSNYGPGVIAYAPGEDVPIVESINRAEGTSFAAPHVSGLLACLLSSELAQKKPPKGAEQKRWTIGDVRTKLQRSFSHAEHEFKGFPINVIFNKIVITDLRIVKMNDSHYTLFLPRAGMAKFVTLQDLVHFCDLLGKADYKECDSFFETTLKIRNATQSCLRAVRSVTVILNGKSHTEATGGTDGLADKRVASFFGNWLPKQLTPPK